MALSTPPSPTGRCAVHRERPLRIASIIRRQNVRKAIVPAARRRVGSGETAEIPRRKTVDGKSLR
ncbi:MAG: hypothetical protein D6725_17555 [Planctomycetota bacterium]|nr:MAG: hypothetical protein D6725_17555 [Planctomycetota bacterium]